MDSTLLVWMNDWRHPALTAGMGLVTWLGSLAVLLLPLALAIGWRGEGAGYWRKRLFLPAAVVRGIPQSPISSSGALTGNVPTFFPAWLRCRRMPVCRRAPMPCRSLPSLPRGWWPAAATAPLLGPVLAGVVLVAVVGFSRLYLQVHFPTHVPVLCIPGRPALGLAAASPAVWRRA
ncbi:MAG: hypothetical protein MZW92_60090 [Comamonadaceae bacterium]|nr:hypothetical protein [Comamonadaceae bacterium]